MRVTLDGRSVEAVLPGRQGRMLLGYLALHRSRVVRREHLQEALWPERTPRSPDAALNSVLARLRAIVGHERLPARGPVRLELGDAAWVDVEIARAAPAAARRALDDGRAQSALELAGEALDILQQPLLPEFERRWLDECRGELDAVRASLIEAVAEAALAVGGSALDRAELIARRGAEREPFRESAHGALMRILAANGNRAEALRVFEALRVRLREELGTSPSIALLRLHQRMLEGDGPASVDPTDGRGARRASPDAPAVPALPALPNRTIGRERDVAAVRGRLRSAPGRLVTLIGPGGVGKTRVALEAARAAQHDFADGAHFVALAAVERPEEVPAAIVSAVGIVTAAGESPGQAAERFFAARHALLLIDNFEHVQAAAPLVGALLAACPALTVLATSREPLALRAEERHLVPPLPLLEPGPAEDGGAAARGDAMTLFDERARAHDPSFRLSDGNARHVAEICRRVDGLPLAIELAAARCALLSPAEIAERLDVALAAPGAASRDAPVRHHTLRATVDWSYELLSPDERTCFTRLAVFAGGATIEAAQSVTGADLDTLDHLVAKSLLVRRRSAHGPTRIDMLHTLRTYAAERLDAAEDREAIRERHFRHTLSVAERHGAEQAVMGVAGKEHLRRLDDDLHNLDAALHWSIAQPDAAPALAMVAALGWYWDLRERHAAEAVAWIDKALALPGAENHPAERVRALLAKPFRLRWLGRVHDGPATISEAHVIARTLGDPVLLAKVCMARTVWSSMEGRLDTADRAADEALRYATAAHDEWQIADAWRCKARAAGDPDELRARVDRAAVLLHDVGNVVRLAQLFGDAAAGALALGHAQLAREFAERAAPMVRDLDNPGIWMYRTVSGIAGLAALLTGDADAARRAFREQLELCRTQRALPIAAEALLGLAAVAVVDGDLRHAARLRGAAGAHGYGRRHDDVPARLDAAFLSPARKRFGPERWDTVVREGTMQSFEDALAHGCD